VSCDFSYGGNFGFGGIFVSTDGGGGGGIGGGGAGGGQNPDTGGGFGGLGSQGLALLGGGGFGGGGGSHWGVGGFGSGNGGDVTSGGDGGDGMGGAIFNMSVGSFPSGVVNAVDCTLAGNSAAGGTGGDGQYTPGSGGSGFGAAIFNFNGLCTLQCSTVDGNEVDGGTGGSVAIGSVFSPNGSSDGGAVYNLAYGNNIVDGKATVASLHLFNSILADSTGGVDLVSKSVSGNHANTADVSGNTNLVETYNLGMQFDTSFITQHASPGLGPLQNNGGLTPTMAILSKSSDAFGKGNPVYAQNVAYDARGSGFDRVVGGRLDLGAHEVQSSEVGGLHPIRPPSNHGPQVVGERFLLDLLEDSHGGHQPRRIPLDAVTLKRGVVHDNALAEWLESIEHGHRHDWVDPWTMEWR
jgi:hypothetical protein